MDERFDVVIVGAGVSGVGSACQLGRALPEASYVLLEGREAIGGTWDLFRYPGIRSDSDMYTFGYSFEPWPGDKSLADGASIREYVQATARKYGVDQKIRFGHRLTRASWSSVEGCWTLEVARADGSTTRIRANFLWMCTGYYRYEAGYTPQFAGIEGFEGQVVHPQRWPEALDYRGKEVVVIGSGATAMTLVPAMAKQAKHVTMLQRSPTYVMSLPARDKVAAALRRALPARLAYRLVRAKNLALGSAFFQVCRRRPEQVRRWLLGQVRSKLGEEMVAAFSPRYKPWDERMCFVPDDDLFLAIREGRASVVTDTIERFEKDGIRLHGSGRALKAEIVVTATGLELLFLGGAALVVDGAAVEPASRMAYRGMMLDDVPNMAFMVGYTNASWTLRVDLVAEYVCRLLRHMKATGAHEVRPRLRESVDAAPFMDLRSGYIQRAVGRLPRQGSKPPWRLRQSYVRELLELRRSKVEDPALEFRRGS
jgi:monooxygenase